MTTICLSSGHGLHVRGASGVLDEVNESRRVVNRVAELLRAAGVTVHVFHDDASRNVSANLNAIVAFHNGRTRDRDVSCHFNAFSPTDNPRGTEVLHRTQQTLASEVSAAMARAGGFVNRGQKHRTNLAFLNRTSRPAILLEVCFVDSTHDAALYRRNFESICAAIAASISGVKIEVPPISPPPSPPPTQPMPSGNNVVEIEITAKGDAAVFINGDQINDAASTNRLELTLEHHGDVIVDINGEDFQVGKPLPLRPILRNGSRGDAVRWLQNTLRVTPVDGIFGPITERAVREFQQQHGLTVDGIVGPLTYAQLDKINVP